MCHESCLAFIERNLRKEEVSGKMVIEIGSMNINGSVRGFINGLGCTKYVGVDFREGNGVDIICDATDIVDKFGKESFDIVISTSFLEHAENWKKVISDTKNICKNGGLMLHTTVSFGYGLHEYPHDFWRYELDDMKRIFSDCDILVLEKDTQVPGVFIKVIKKKNVNDLSNYQLYNITFNRRVQNMKID